MKLNSQQRQILRSIEENSCTQVSQDDAFIRAVRACKTDQEVFDQLQYVSYFLGLIETYSTGAPVSNWYWN